MAFIDQNGKITIDEVAANKDITNLSLSADSLNSVLDLINQIIVMASELDTSTNSRIIDECNDIKRKISELLSSTSETADYIKCVVKKYQAIDQQMKKTVESLNGTGEK